MNIRHGLLTLILACSWSPAYSNTTAEKFSLDEMFSFSNPKSCLPDDPFFSFIRSFYENVNDKQISLKVPLFSNGYMPDSEDTKFNVYQEDWYEFETRTRNNYLYGIEVHSIKSIVKIPSSELDFTIVFKGDLKGVQEVLSSKGFWVSANENINVTGEDFQAATLLSLADDKSGHVLFNCVFSPA
jgi:hypothetical protein